MASSHGRSLMNDVIPSEKSLDHAEEGDVARGDEHPKGDEVMTGLTIVSEASNERANSGGCNPVTQTIDLH